MNLSIHLPPEVSQRLDVFAQAHQSSRSRVVRDAVEHYLAAHAQSRWPEALSTWMEAPTLVENQAEPNFTALRDENNRLFDRPNPAPTTAQFP
jgi:metal-responsive CopG/Arc/MetJ family transcriptional regulator